jgi:CheY-like chemotaxis protein
MKLEPSEVKGKEIVDEVKNIFEKQVKQKNINFSIEVEKPELLEIPLYIDSVKIKQIIVNLISNSYKFTPPGGSIKVKLYDMNIVPKKFKKTRMTKLNDDQEFCEKARLHYKISVEDTGIGMSKEFLPKLFNPFEQESQAYKTELAGTGLGTTIIKKLVDLMGGSIKVKSEVGKGTIFELKLFADIISKDTLKQKEVDEELDLAKIDFSNLKILLVEDNKLNEIVAKKVLSKKNISSTWAKNGYEAIKYLLESEPFTYDAVLMDIRMPGIDGWETTKKIRAIQRKDIATIPIIAMTANVFEEEVKKSFAVGMNEHLSKPINTKKLFKVLLKYCKVDT